MRFLKYLGNDYILGEIVGESKDEFYWLVRRMPTKNDTEQRIVAHPKWDTEVVNEDDLINSLKEAEDERSK